MKLLRHSPSLAALLVLSSLPVQAQLIISEIMQDPSAVGDSNGEYFELYNPTGAAIDIDGWVIKDAGSNTHTISNGGPLEVPAGGFLVLGNNADFATNGSVVVGYEYSGFFLGNSDDEVILEDDLGAEIDRVEYDGGPNFPDPSGASMELKDLTLDNNVGGNWAEAITEIVPGGDKGTPGAGPPVGNGQLGLSLDVASISEDQSAFITGTVTAPVAPTSDLTVTVTLSDETEAITADATIFANDTTGTFLIDAVDDFWADGDQTVTVTVSAPTYDPNDTTFTVTDDDAGFLVIINEVYNAIDSLPFDANNDGTGNSDDEFIEVVNVSGGTLDLSGATLSDESFVRHIFPPGTILEPGCAVLVFAGGDVQEGSVQFDFGDTPVQIADSGTQFPGLSLTDTGDAVFLRDTDGSITGVFDAEVHAVTLPDQSGDLVASSITTSTDTDASSGYILHTATIEGTEMSPGTTPAGGSYCSLTDSITVTINPGTRTESDGFVAMAGTVSIPAAIGSDLFVYVDSSDLGEIDLSLISPLIIPSGSTSADLDLLFVDDAEADGTQTVTLTGRAIGYLNGTASVDVEDDGDAGVFTDLVINEFDANQPGTDDAEFIELYNNSGTLQPLDGLVVVLFNGSNDTIYDAYDLTGFSIDGNGFFVIGNGSVPSPQITLSSLQNGADAIALYSGSIADYPNGASVVGLQGTLIDAVVYGGSDTGLQDALDPSGSSVAESGSADSAAARTTDGGSPFASNLFVTQSPTPGATNVIAENSFATWAADQVPAIVDGPDGDADLDGIANLVEYALGLDPNAANGTPGTLSGGTLTFTKGPEAKMDGNLIYEIETSTDLGVTDPWAPNGSAVDGSDDISLDIITAGGVATKFFARLNVSEAVVAE
ncbi:lamin tail domain-containing protein [Haloferula rosea]|uniref:Lamin tail domain-containing protein n=1 Tax=Haloferula rosea TaxID=490093 RepID=A0A934RDC9_9BACT|nr:lamin tail domain-containing protein [Haloferula rosea]MBK1827502.1 lamin tail domain-containing protein [Haloferula rosea]